jgi:hypothetical protein
MQGPSRTTAAPRATGTGRIAETDVCHEGVTILVTGANRLDLTVESVTSALKRARASLQRRQASAGDREPPPASNSPSEDAIVAKFVHAWESADLERAGGPADRRRLRLHAADTVRVRGPRRRGPVLRRRVPGLVAAGHEVHGMTRSESKQATDVR